MDNKILEILYLVQLEDLEAKYYKSKKNTSPIALSFTTTSSIWWNNE